MLKQRENVSFREFLLFAACSCIWNIFLESILPVPCLKQLFSEFFIFFDQLARSLEHVLDDFQVALFHSTDEQNLILFILFQQCINLFLRHCGWFLDFVEYLRDCFHSSSKKTNLLRGCLFFFSLLWYFLLIMFSKKYLHLLQFQTFNNLF